MIAVITGDIINSTENASINWLKELKSVLDQYGSSPEKWEIYRGDSFQLKLPVEKAITAAFHIKSTIKQIKNKDVRIGIGVGKEDYISEKISESNGIAYQNSGLSFESLKKNTLSIKSNDASWDEPLNIMLELVLFIADKWTTSQAEAIKASIENPNKNQNQLAELLQKTQSTISASLDRSGYDSLKKIVDYYKKQTQLL
ncbi:SatD family protein [Marivirga salinae]|uniref:SatD family protein n=1 Tax=Marivirga salinarum TaxID=3059078 RepID=A0AA51N9W3_9BACT|nr:SatD family protein [Marivirga sp. BDSF4-3]WMN11482.1 SatD family protein [Marivirga sp. BDSF4-3]